MTRLSFAQVVRGSINSITVPTLVVVATNNAQGIDRGGCTLGARDEFDPIFTSSKSANEKYLRSS